jgi:hypothetical protein
MNFTTKVQRRLPYQITTKSVKYFIEYVKSLFIFMCSAILQPDNVTEINVRD